jgi:hypothetical protein
MPPSSLPLRIKVTKTITKMKKYITHGPLPPQQLKL